ncbi:N-acetylglucosamine-6-phosphate deacetylase [Deinococcus multiflagellatus]|uniref:N-acetylglucosamine-6-phosphate deacetylase n=1 Tax=Deinococcus multiflagellatus TaxID=1656887 RepID=UPI001CCCF3DB|nr:N-acetylglucosamine-6-phosphate deacetylase [Deinococcus multiflagellatus]MBZ9714986.1 N-acetylglucosamine-6-phosphate deacetylase [Deinococcus multiflagellatus]
MTITLSGQLLLPSGLQSGRLTVQEGRIAQLEPLPSADPTVLILPGFVDTHVHGGAGGDTMDGPEGIRTLARLHARHGTTTLLPTTITNPWPEVLRALRAVAQVIQEGGAPGGADLPGAHLEGPFISPGRLGAQPPCAVDPTPERVAEVLATGAVRAVTLAPELPGALDAARTFARAGVRVGIGHTRADAETVQVALAAVHQAGGQSCATHLFNAMGGIEGRVPGPPGALIADPHATLEVILDGLHVHPTSFLLARAAAPERVMLITDAMRAAGLGDGPSELGGQPVTVQGGKATLADGTLAGSVLTLDAALRRAAALGVPLPELSRMLSLTPARSVGLHDRGELRTGLRADLVVLNADLQVQATYVGGMAVG